MSNQAEPKQIRVLIVEDHAVTRLGIKMFLESSADIQVVGEASTGVDAIELAGKLQPDIVLMDVQMPGMDGVEAARKIAGSTTGSRIVMMTSSRDERDVFASLTAGASGYCTKDISDDRLLFAIRTVHAGDVWLDSAIASKVLGTLPRQSTSALDTDYQLSDRELEVLGLIVDGLSNLEISKRLFISADTVKSHIKHVLDKLSVTDRTQAAVKALRENIVK
jgi:DNA-binding NarL/FixJ family response regulator